MDDELRELQEYSAQVEAFRIEKRKNKISMTPDSVQSMEVSEFFEKHLEDAKTLVEDEVEKQLKSIESLGMDVTPKIEQEIVEKIK